MLFLGCGSEAAPERVGEEQPIVERTVEEDTTAPDAYTDEQLIGFIRNEYTAVAGEVTREVLLVDSLEYQCADPAGQFWVYSDPETEESRLIVNSYSLGDHYGVTEYWYLSEGEPFFLLREAGSWRFGGAMTTDDAGNEVPGTIDEITEERFYVHEGRILRHLRKEYTIESWREIPDPNEVPNVTVEPPGELPRTLEWVGLSEEDWTVDCDKIDEVIRQSL